jgi:hypothetical protein
MRRTGIRLLLVLAGALAAVLLSGAPALAGNWAVTSLDPLPDRIEPNRPYTIGFWVLQHGSHPYSGGVLDPVGLKFVADNGKATTYPGIALPEPAHYAAAVILPAGTYQVFGVQGPFQDYRVGTLAVPGGLTALAVPPPLDVGAAQQPWGAIPSIRTAARSATRVRLRVWSRLRPQPRRSRRIRRQRPTRQAVGARERWSPSS